MATRTDQEKKKKKKWIPILASKEFNNQQIGETYIEEPEKCIGNNITTNLMLLTREPKKQSFNIKFKIIELKNDQALTDLISYSMQVAQLKRIIKKGRDKVEDSFEYKTKDDIKVVIKPILLTKTLTYKTTLQSIRKVTREFLTDYTKKHTFLQIMKDVISGKLQRDLKTNSKKVYPVISCIIKDTHKVN